MIKLFSWQKDSVNYQVEIAKKIWWVTNAILLSQLVYWIQNKDVNLDSRAIRKTDKDRSDELWFSVWEISKARKSLEEQKLHCITLKEEKFFAS